MLSSTRTIIRLAYGQPCHTTTSQLLNQTFRGRHHSRHKALVYCATRQIHQYNEQAESSTSQAAKSQLPERIRGLHKQYRTFVLPNILSASRLVLGPVTGYFIMNGMNSLALACVATAAFTDVADKAVAKMTNYNSNLNQAVDFLSDRTFNLITMVCLAKMDLMPFWLVKGLFFRDVSFLCGAPLLRWGGFGETFTWKRFFDFHNYPTLGLSPSIGARMLIAMQYTLYAIYLYHGQPVAEQIELSKPMLCLEISTTIVCAVSSAMVWMRIVKAPVVTRPYNI